MKIKILSPLIFDKSRLFLGSQPVGVAFVKISINQEEVDILITTAQRIWRKLLEITGIKNFLGLVRFDLVPAFNENYFYIDTDGEIDLSNIMVKGVYEVNTHSPECAAAVSALHHFYPELAKLQPSASSLLAAALRKKFGREKIIFVRGDGLVKREWGDIFYRDLVNNGINLLEMTPEQVVKEKPEIIWRWGDCRFNGYSEFPTWFIYWLAFEYKGIVFNTMPTPDVDISDKRYLLPNHDDNDVEWNRLVGENKLLTSDNVDWALKYRENLVAKPLLGSSGRGIFIGRISKEWEKVIMENLNNNYGLFEARWLPRIEIGRQSFAMDVNPAFFADGESLEYLYTVVRIDIWERYWHTGIINVSQGGGFAGAINLSNIKKIY